MVHRFFLQVVVPAEGQGEGRPQDQGRCGQRAELVRFLARAGGRPVLLLTTRRWWGRLRRRLRASLVARGGGLPGGKEEVLLRVWARGRG